ncbi:radical SAM protein [Ferroacidibacillus organovorans]|uniref:Radical SAM protein n=1 Tax=Ferroacidibacillus organovorans TaxID=1765683 RepID=A0A168C290_9BACL|nr:radical SAM protein [Ferroacidibacillus organovorans]KYP81485.1 radical SAM protein [Ferroacidibacillus organovorans]OAG94014.1 radical SAM protein [Ferroacidibacillus organovorans]OPG16743.1 radical SAM protein [Ferroacidibacillus organovorans]
MKLVYADVRGRVFDSETLLAVGRTGTAVTELTEEEWIPLPSGAVLAGMPDTKALGYDPEQSKLKALPPTFRAVGALLPQGYTRLYVPAYHKAQDTKPFPLFGYTAVGFRDGVFYVAAHETDRPALWDPTQYTDVQIQTAVNATRSAHPANRVYEQLSTCALTYECVTSRNTFVGKNEGGLPVSSSCNAGCVGCISDQPDEAGFPSPQIRMSFRPSVDEMVEVMVQHLVRSGPSGIISFGQGCEGEPATRGREIAESIVRVRRQVSTGYININTNAGLTHQIKRIVDSGLDLMRVSTISACADHYDAYYQPRGYTLDHVAESTRYAAEHGVLVSLNYLIFPGVSDTPTELDAMIEFIRSTGVRLVQMRNLNIDPDYYLQRVPQRKEEPIGILAMMETLIEECPGLRVGSYTHEPGWFEKPLAQPNGHL